MSGERAQSGVFAVSHEDYRRAFALAIASWVEPEAPRGEMRGRVFDYWWLGSAMGVLAACVWGLCNYALYGPSLFLFVIGMQMGLIAGVVAVLMLPVAVLIAMLIGGDARGARRRFPAEQASRKQPRRIRVGWDDSGFKVAGKDVAHFDWNSLYAWLDGAREFVVFTAVCDPVPVPHGVLADDEVAALRGRLIARGVPRAWRPEPDDAFGLKLVFG